MCEGRENGTSRRVAIKFLRRRAERVQTAAGVCAGVKVMPRRVPHKRGEGSGAETAFEVSYGRNRKHVYGGGTESGPRSRGNQNRNHNSTPALPSKRGGRRENK